MALVVGGLAAFSITTAYVTRTQVDQAEQAESLSDSYGDATEAIRAVQSSELEFLVDPSPTHRDGLAEANRALVDTIRQVAAQGGQEEAWLAADILRLHEQYSAASTRLVEAMDAGDTVRAHRIRQAAGPIFDAMHGLISAATARRAAEAKTAFTTLRDTARWSLVASAAIFALGFVLLLGLWRILERYHRATYETYREIEQLSRLRSEFVSIVSHEFRTPLTGIQGFSEIIRDEELSREQMREFASDINKDARRLARLITDMLDLDRMESGRMALRTETLDINQIVNDAAAAFRANSTNHRIGLQLDPGPLLVSGDADRLGQVVTNLVSNAVKYSPRGGTVDVVTRRDPSAIVLEVRDEGIGIPTDQLDKIFERYSRVETPETRGIQGTGLGLPIVRQIVHMHSGTVWATSQPGVGSIFHVQLPSTSPSAVAHRAA